MSNGWTSASCGSAGACIAGDDTSGAGASRTENVFGIGSAVPRGTANLRLRAIECVTKISLVEVGRLPSMPPRIDRTSQRLRTFVTTRISEASRTGSVPCDALTVYEIVRVTVTSTRPACSSPRRASVPLAR